MVQGVGGSTFAAELDRMVPMTGERRPDRCRGIPGPHRQGPARLMREQGVDALYLDTSTNLRYFTGIALGLTERLHGAVIPAEGDIAYLSPSLRGTQDPHPAALRRRYTLLGRARGPDRPGNRHGTQHRGYDSGTIGLDPAAPFFTVDGLRKAGNSFGFSNGSAITAACRMVKSPAEVALMQVAMDITLAVHKAAARCMAPGLGTAEVQAFLDAAHRKLGGQPASRAVQFGEATAYPHGVPYAQTLDQGDMVLVDTGCFVEGYRSDITRTYVFGDPHAPPARNLGAGAACPARRLRRRRARRPVRGGGRRRPAA